MRLPPLPSSSFFPGPSRPLDSRAACLWLLCPSSLSPLLCLNWPAPRSMSAPRGSTLRVSLPPSACLRHPHVFSPPFWPRPAAQYLLVPRGLFCVLCFPLSHVNLPRSPCCRAVSWCLLVFGVFVGCPFALKREARVLPLPGDCSPRTFPLRYLGIPAPLKLWGVALEVRRMHEYFSHSWVCLASRSEGLIMDCL